MEPYQLPAQHVSQFGLVLGMVIAAGLLGLIYLIDERFYWVAAAAMIAGLLKIVIIGQ